MKHKKLTLSALTSIVKDTIKENKKDFYEKRIRTLEGEHVLYASPKHLADLEGRMHAYKSMAEQQRSRTAARQSYSNAYRRCRAQLETATKYAARNGMLVISEDDETAEGV